MTEISWNDNDATFVHNFENKMKLSTSKSSSADKIVSVMEPESES